MLELTNPALQMSRRVYMVVSDVVRVRCECDECEGHRPERCDKEALVRQRGTGTPLCADCLINLNKKREKTTTP